MILHSVEDFLAISTRGGIIMKAQSSLLRCLLAALLFVAFALAAHAQTNQAEPSLPYSPSLDVTSMDRSVDPCVDFYQYSCGGWQEKNPIPADQTGWSVYGKLYEDNLGFLRGILEQAATAKQRDSVTQKIGDFYAACMDEAAVDKQGLAAIQSELDAIAALKDTRSMASLVARLQREMPGNPILFHGGSAQDPDNSEHEILALDQGGIGLPDRDYYTNDDDKSKETRARYLAHVEKIFELLGDATAAAKANADTVMRMETSLARASLTQVERRDPYKMKNKMKIADLATLAPTFDWSAYIKETQAPAFETLNVTAPAFFKELNSQLGSEGLANWKTYLRFQVANAYSPYLSQPFVQENFEFYLQYLRGAKEQQPRWKRCVQYADDNLGEALGQAYVAKVFSPELKESTLQMVQLVEKAMKERINELDWMSPETKAQALKKLQGIRNKIGYPDKWRDYSSLKIVPNDFVGNMRNAILFESHRDLNKIGKPVDHGEWYMTPPTVNAYYDAQMNDINFAAGVLQPPLYDSRMDDAPNYGNTGGTIGHELTHGFDDEGRQYDAAGNLKDWWTKGDADEFKKRTQCVKDQYAQYIAVDDIHINSALTLGEDVADLGGEILAYLAWRDSIKDKRLRPVDGLTPDQRFFVGFAQWACANQRPEDQRLRAMTDPHSPPRYRINGVVVNMPEFAQAFSCKPDQPMVKPEANVCKVW